MEPRIVQIPAATVARFHALSASPETEAWERLRTWAEPRGLLRESSDARVYGFNNPDPSAGSPNYGYEFWITVDGIPDTDLSDVETVRFPGGSYATAAFEEDDPYKLPDAWMRLVEWAEAEGLGRGTHQWLEGHTMAGWPVRLYLPLAAEAEATEEVPKRAPKFHDSQRCE